MYLIAPNGGRVRVADQRVPALRQKGYRLPEAAVKAAAPAAPAPAKRGRPAKKTDSSETNSDQ